MITQIAGIVAPEGGEPPEPQLQAMLDAMNPLGRPARRDTARLGPALFGALTIAVGDARPLPPALVRDDGTLFVADARLWDSATAGQGAAPPAGQDQDDARRIAAAVRREGWGAAARLHGDFAWARWDGRALELVRDHFGARPLYYTAHPGRMVAFASHPAALLAAGLARPALDMTSVLNFAANNAPLAGRFYQADIATLRPAHLARIGGDGGVETRRYWRPPIGPRLSERTDPEEVSAEIRRLLDQAVRRRLPASGPVGGHLSGGIDSTPLAVLAARAMRGQGRTFFGYSFEEPTGALDFDLVDEASYVAEVVAAEPGIELVPVSEPGFVGPLLGPYYPSLLEPAAEDEPEHQVLAHARAVGVDTILSGWGGDQILSYHARFPAAELFLHGQWGMMLAELGRFRAGLATAFYYQVVLPLLPEPWRSRLARLTGRGALPRPPRPLFRPATLPPQDPPEHAVPPEGRSFRARREMVERNFIQHRLAHFAHLGAPRGVRYVYPLLDLDLVAYAMRVPCWFLARDGGSRRLLRDAIRGVVPERVRQRTDKLFPHSLDTLRLPRLRDRFDARLAAIPADGIAAHAVDIAALRQALRDGVDTPEATLRQMREHAARGEQLYIKGFDCLAALQLALALDDYQRHFGAEAAAPPATVLEAGQ